MAFARTIKKPWIYRGNVCIEIKDDAKRITVRVDQDALDDVDQTPHDNAGRLRSAEKHMEVILSATEKKIAAGEINADGEIALGSADLGAKGGRRYI